MPAQKVLNWKEMEHLNTMFIQFEVELFIQDSVNFILSKKMHLFKTKVTINYVSITHEMKVKVDLLRTNTEETKKAFQMKMLQFRKLQMITLQMQYMQSSQCTSNHQTRVSKTKYDFQTNPITMFLATKISVSSHVRTLNLQSIHIYFSY